MEQQIAVVFGACLHRAHGSWFELLYNVTKVRVLHVNFRELKIHSERRTRVVADENLSI